MSLLMTTTASSRRFARLAPAVTQTEKPARLVTYTTLMELRTTLRAIDATAGMTVVLALDERFCGHLTSLIERPATSTANGPAMRLILAVGTGRLPGLVTIGDLASSGAALGWQEIVLESDAMEAVAGALATLRRSEQLLLLFPSWHDVAWVERLSAIAG